MTTTFGLQAFWLCFLFALLSPVAHAIPPRPFASRSHAGTFTVPLARNHNRRLNGPAAYARALAKWNIDVPDTVSNYLGNQYDGMSRIGGRIAIIVLWQPQDSGCIC